MIQLLFGDNSFAINQAVRGLAANFSGEIEKIDGGSLALPQLPDLLMGAMLFSHERLIVIDGLSKNKELWGQLFTWLERLSDNTQLILIEPSVDKRTKTYKWLQKNANTKELMQWRDYESGKAVKWLLEYAESRSTILERTVAITMVSRAVVLSDQAKAVIDQQLLAKVVESLQVSNEPVDEDLLNTVLPPSMYENVFELLSKSIRGDLAHVRDAVKRLEMSEDGHKVSALICSQAVNLGVLNAARASGISTSQVAKDVGVHPFALSQLEPIVERLSPEQARQVVEQVGKMDYMIKTGQLEPWTAISTTLIKIAATNRDD